jgi:hypothetical protein
MSFVLPLRRLQLFLELEPPAPLKILKTKKSLPLKILSRALMMTQKTIPPLSPLVAILRMMHNGIMVRGAQQVCGL